MAFVLAVLFFANVPGRIASRVDLFRSGQYSVEFAHDVAFEHGWPLVWLTRSTVNSLPRSGAGWHASTSWRLAEGVLKFIPGNLSINLAIAAVLVVIGGATFEAWRRRRVSLRHLPLRELFFLIGACAGLMAMITLKHSEYRQEQVALDVLNRHHVERGATGRIHPTISPGGPTWLRELLRKHFPDFMDRVIAIDIDGDEISSLTNFRHLEIVHIYNAVRNEQLASLTGQTSLNGLSLAWSYVAVNYDADEVPSFRSIELPTLPRLRGLNLRECDYRAEGLAHLPNLVTLDLGGTSTTDADVLHLAACKSLEYLDLSDTNITAAVLPHLTDLKQLRTLNLGSLGLGADDIRILENLPELRDLTFDGTALNDDGIERLAALRKLESIDVSRPVSDRLLGELRIALPGCTVR